MSEVTCRSYPGAHSATICVACEPTRPTGRRKNRTIRPLRRAVRPACHLHSRTLCATAVHQTRSKGRPARPHRKPSTSPASWTLRALSQVFRVQNAIFLASCVQRFPNEHWPVSPCLVHVSHLPSRHKIDGRLFPETWEARSGRATADTHRYRHDNGPPLHDVLQI